jgi:hypothetical protein
MPIEMSPHNHNIYRLIGNNENALTYALGHLIAIDAGFMLSVLKEISVLKKIPGKPYKEYSSNYFVKLQEHKDNGIRDIVIEAGDINGLRVIIEAKIGKGMPSASQLLKYSIGEKPQASHKKTEKLWGQKQHKYIVSLTRDRLDSSIKRGVSEKLAGTGIKLLDTSWSMILEIALKYLKHQDIGQLHRAFIQEFIDFFREDYEMHSYQAEVMVKKDNLLNAEKIYLEGYMYVGGESDIQIPLYFAPYFTKECIGHAGITDSGISYISSVIKVITTTAGKLKEDPEAIATEEIKAHELWPQWKKGLNAISKRAINEHWAKTHINQLYFLSKPAKLNRKHPVKGPAQIHAGYSTTVIDLLIKDNLIKKLGITRQQDNNIS